MQSSPGPQSTSPREAHHCKRANIILAFSARTTSSVFHSTCGQSEMFARLYPPHSQRHLDAFHSYIEAVNSLSKAMSKAENVHVVLGGKKILFQ